MIKRLAAAVAASLLVSAAIGAEDGIMEGTADSILSSPSSTQFKGHATVKLHTDSFAVSSAGVSSGLSSSRNVIRTRGEATVKVQGMQIHGTDLQLRREADGTLVITSDSITVVREPPIA